MSEMRGILTHENRTITKSRRSVFWHINFRFEVEKGVLSLTLFAGCSQVRNAGDQVFKPSFANYA